MRRALLVMTLAVGSAILVAGAEREARLRDARQHSRRRAEPLAGDGSRLVAERRLRSAPHRIARHPAGQRVDDEEVPRVGAGQRAPGALELRQGLVAGALHRAPGRAADPAADRLPAGVVVRHQGPGHRRRRPRADRERGRLREVSRQADRQDRPRSAGARGADARRADHPADDGQDIAEAETTPVPGGGRRRPRQRRGGVPPEGLATSTSRKASSRCSTAAATATWRPAAAICRGSSSIPTAGRSSRTARARATTRPARACR